MYRKYPNSLLNDIRIMGKDIPVHWCIVAGLLLMEFYWSQISELAGPMLKAFILCVSGVTGILHLSVSIHVFLVLRRKRVVLLVRW